MQRSTPSVRPALATRRPSSSTLRVGDSVFFQLHAAPVHHREAPTDHLIVSVRDVTIEVLQRQKLEAIHRAGIELADMTPEEIFNMGVEDRIELLKEGETKVRAKPAAAPRVEEEEREEREEQEETPASQEQAQGQTEGQQPTGEQAQGQAPAEQQTPPAEGDKPKS